MPAKGTGGKHRQPKAKSKEVKQWVKRSGTRTGPGTVKSAQKKAEKAVVAKAKSNRDATQKMYAAESMFKSAKARDDAKTTPGKARPFKDAFDDATKKGKSKFLWKGKGFLTTKGKREKRFGSSKDIKKVPDLEERRMKKRVKWMEKRKKEGKGYSAKNLAELTKKLEKLNIR